jgi:hypothetical protein
MREDRGMFSKLRRADRLVRAVAPAELNSLLLPLLVASSCIADIGFAPSQDGLVRFNRWFHVPTVDGTGEFPIPLLGWFI